MVSNCGRWAKSQPKRKSQSIYFENLHPSLSKDDAKGKNSREHGAKSMRKIAQSLKPMTKATN